MLCQLTPKSSVRKKAAVAAENLTNRRGNRIEYVVHVLPVLIVLPSHISAHMNNGGMILYYHYHA